MGEIPGVLLVKAKKSTLDSNMLIEQVKSYCEALPTFKRPKKLALTKQLPITTNGKKIRDKQTLSKFI